VSVSRVLRWLWGDGAAARVARLPLVPLAGVYWGGMKLRAAGYQRGWRTTHRLPLPVVAVGNLSVGGTGKTPLAAWVARYCADRGRAPGILLRGYGADEPLVHRRLVPQAIVVADPDRVAGARRALEQGARVLVLDDAFQLLEVARDLNIAVVSAESAAGSPWPLPAGPWRERWDALDRADIVVVTRKRASVGAAETLAGRLALRGGPRRPVCVACLAVDRLEGMETGTRHDLALLADRRVVAAAGIADPDAFAAQLAAAGARVQLVAYQDHHPYRDADVTRLVRAAAGAYVVVTEKDAVKLRGRWPGHTPEPLVAGLAVRWEQNARALEQALEAVLLEPRAS
jgi:tetraacyldisaccharide 4'-kinase